MDINIKGGSIIGRKHKELDRNNQDGYSFVKAEINGYSFATGVVTDGCSSGVHSEVGSLFFAKSIPYVIKQLAEEDLGINEIPNVLFKLIKKDLENFLNLSNCQSREEEIQYISENLLFTILGFIVINEEVVCFSCGDGVLAIGNYINPIMQENTPSYIGYTLLDQNEILDTTKIPLDFEIFSFSINQVEKFALCTDAFMQDLSLLNSEIWELGENNRSLQRKLISLSRKENKEYFYDDATIITVELQ